MRKQCLIYHIGTGVGFYSEFNNMILCMVLALQHGIDFTIYSRDAFFFDGKGWQKYFEPFCKEKKSRIHHYINRRVSSILHDSVKSWFADKFLIIGSSLYKLFTGNFLTQDFFFSSRSVWFQNSTFNIPQHNLQGDLLAVSNALIEKIYKFNPKYQDIIGKTISELALPDHFIGLHIRGGDKITEKDLFSISKYMEVAENCSSCRNAFVLTDDYQIINSLKKNYLDWSFYTLTFPDECGYVNASFEAKSVERREKEMIKVFASVEVIRKSDLFIGTYSSNIGMFLGMLMPKDKVIALDSKEWYIL